MSYSRKLFKEFKQCLSHLENSACGSECQCDRKSVNLKGQLNIFLLKTVFYTEVEMTQK